MRSCFHIRCLIQNPQHKKLRRPHTALGNFTSPSSPTRTTFAEIITVRPTSIHALNILTQVVHFCVRYYFLTVCLVCRYLATRKSHFPSTRLDGGGVLFLFALVVPAAQILFTVITWRMKIFPGENKPDRENIITQNKANRPSQRIFHDTGQDDEQSTRREIARAKFSAAQIHTSTSANKRRYWQEKSDDERENTFPSFE